MRRPILTARIIRGILAIEDACGGMLTEDEAIRDVSGMTRARYREAQDALKWARAMEHHRAARRATTVGGSAK